MRIATVALLIAVTVPCVIASHGCSSTWSVRLYPNYGTYGVLQVCYSGLWRTACEYDWTIEEVKVACNQLGLSGGCQAPVISAGSYYGYSWSYYLSFYFDCLGTESSLSQCPTHYPPSYYYCNDGYSDAAGVICSTSTVVGSDGCTDNSVQLLGGSAPGEGRPEFCMDNTWTPMCSLSAATASLICQDQGFTEYTAGAIYGDERYGTSGTSNYFSTLACSDTDTDLSDCITEYKNFCTSSTCTTEYGMKCFNPGICTDGEVRLVGGDIEQEGRAEVCYNGVWGVICDYGWNTIDGFIFCTDLGYVEPGTGPSSYYNSYFGDGDYPMVYSYVSCNGWEKNFVDCPKEVFPSFTYEQYCTRSDVIGLRCYEDCVHGDIRLTGGTDSVGTVEICYGQLWGLVAETGWTITDAQVACRQLGFPTDSAVALVGSPFGKANKTIHLTNVNCVGSEERIDDCTKTSVPLSTGKTSYANVDVAGVQCVPHMGPVCIDNPTGTPPGSDCNSGDAKFADGSVGDEGILLFCYKGRWSPFCTISEEAAAVACKQLGYAFFTGASVFTEADYPLYMNHSLFTNITCSSDAVESSLASCTYYETECLPYCESNIALKCYNPGTCTEGKVRLVSSVIEQEGRVEVCFNGVWSSICDDGWDKTDAYIICRQLGYGQLEPVAYYNSYFGDGDGPIVYSQVACGGWEDSLDECNKTEQFGFSCSRQQVAGVLCGFDCVEGDIRLTNNETSLGTVSGIVEVCFDNLWGLISESSWSDPDAQVACRQLGYEAKGAARVSGGTVTKPNKTVHLGNVICIGDEESLSECSATSYSLEEGKALLDQVNIARVSCPIPTDCDVPPTGGLECQTGESRLTGGIVNGEGNLEYCYNGNWSPVCNLAFTDAAVACRQFGFEDYSWASVYTDGRYGSSGGDVVSMFHSFNCSGSQFSLEDCAIIDNCTSTCSTPVAIKCYEQQQCEEGGIRLVDGDIDQEGRVEVCINGVWGSVCSAGWDDTDAFVTCKYLGYGDAEPVVYTDSKYGEGQGPIVISNVVCEGWERSLTDCELYGYGSFYCSHDQTIGIFCHNECDDGEIRLVGSENSDKEGIVEICFGTLWGLISESSWSDENAQVVCSQLNFPPSRSRTAPGTSYTKPNTTVHLSNVMCTGSEDEITNCPYTPVPLDEGKLLTSHIDAASVQCDIYIPEPEETRPPGGSDPEAAGSSDSSGVSTTGLAIIGALGAVFVVMVVIVVIVVTVLGFKAKHVSIMRPNDGQEDTFPLDEKCIKTDLSRDKDNPVFDDLLEQ